MIVDLPLPGFPVTGVKVSLLQVLCGENRDSLTPVYVTKLAGLQPLGELIAESAATRVAKRVLEYPVEGIPMSLSHLFFAIFH